MARQARPTELERARRGSGSRAIARPRGLPPPPRRRGQRRRPPEEPPDAPSGDRPGYRRPARPRALAAGVLLRIRRWPVEAARDQGNGGVGAEQPDATGSERRALGTIPATRGRSVVVAQKPSKLLGRVRFPSPALGGLSSPDHGEWRSLVAHPAGGRAVAGSNPVSPM